MKRRRTLLLFAAFALLLLTALAWVGARRLTRGVLLVSARVSNTGEMRAPAPQGTTFYLLDEDMIELAQVKEGRLSPAQEKVFRENPKLRNLAGLMNARRREAYSLGPEVASFMEQSRPLWQPHVLQSRESDAAGRAVFTDLSPGQYWLMGCIKMQGEGVAFWNLSVQVKRGETSVTLDSSNALQCSGCP